MVIVFFVRSQIKPILQGHWNKLYEHFTELLKCRAMSPQEIAETFAPHMISYDSPYETQVSKNKSVSQVILIVSTRSIWLYFGLAFAMPPHRDFLRVTLSAEN